MPTAYKGRFRISCIPEVCTRDKARADVAVDPCFICPLSESAIVGLDDELIFSMGSPEKITLTPKEAEEKTPETVAAAEKGKKRR